MGMLLMNLRRSVQFRLVDYPVENDLQTQEPRKGGNRKLNIDSREMFVEYGQAFMYERLEYPLIEESTVH